MSYHALAVTWRWVVMASVVLYVVTDIPEVLFAALLAAIYSAEYSILNEVKSEGFRRFADKISDKEER